MRHELISIFIKNNSAKHFSKLRDTNIHQITHFLTLKKGPKKKEITTKKSNGNGDICDHDGPIFI